MADTPVLIAGAGPTGLVLALWLARRGVPFRLLDTDDGPGPHSRAMAVHARTLEFYDALGLADDVVAAGMRIERARFREGRRRADREVLTFRLGDLGQGLSPYPFVLSYPQDEHERFLVARLREAGVEVEWGTALTGFTQDAEGVTATITRKDGREETVRADWLCGSDGARSRVRHVLDLPFPGGTYEQLYYVADARVRGGFPREIVVNLGEDVLALMLPIRTTGMFRLIGLVPRHLGNRADLTFEDIRAEVEGFLGITVEELNWFSTYRVHHRVAERFRVGRAFLLGDAGHIHSPAGGQGMNTGIGDAVNLGWKLAEVVAGRADPSLLDTYEGERIAFARTLVGTTDRAFTPMVAGGWRGEVTRRVVAPLALGLATRIGAGRRLAFRTLSQIHIHYPDSALSEGQAGTVRGGDRLPWNRGDGGTNFAALRGLTWGVHAYGRIAPPLRAALARLGLPAHEFPWSDGAREAGFARDAAYLVRPDGYVALAVPDGGASAIEDYLRRHSLRPGGG